MHKFLILIVLASTFGCNSDESIVVDDTLTEVLPEVVVEIGPRTEVDSPEDTNNCDASIEILDGYTFEMVEVTSELKFTLNEDSPKGELTERSNTVLTVDATAYCGDIILEGVYLQTYEEGNGLMWMSDMQNQVSGISYDYGSMTIFSGYDLYHSNKTWSSVTGLYWDHSFVQPVLIPEGETFTFSLKTTIGDTLPTGPVRFNLYPRHRWYGLDNPDIYPETIGTDLVRGHYLTYNLAE